MAGCIESRQGIHEGNYFSNSQSSQFSMKKHILTDFPEDKFFQTLSALGLWIFILVLSHREADCSDVSPKESDA